MIFSVDPGTTESGWCEFLDGRLFRCGILDNEALLARCRVERPTLFAIEAVASYGMPVGREVFETCFMIGKCLEAVGSRGIPTKLVYRKDVKLHLCGSPRAKDANIRQALIDKLGPVGTKKAPGPLYGVKSHAWAALAVAVTVAERKP
jgi:hypothetical protein